MSVFNSIAYLHNNICPPILPATFSSDYLLLRKDDYTINCNPLIIIIAIKVLIKPLRIKKKMNKNQVIGYNRRYKKF